MKRYVLFLFVGVISTSVAFGVEQEEAKPAKAVKLHGARISVLRDGGSSAIFIPAINGKPAHNIIVDGSSGTSTHGEIFLSEKFSPGKQPLSGAEVEVLFKQLEEVLIAHYGAEKLLEIILNPIEPKVHLSEKEFGDKLSDPEFNDLLEARYLMQEIIDYRTRHGRAVALPEK